VIRLMLINNAVECRITSRVNRFKVLVETPYGEDYAYINNTGRLREYMVTGRTAYCLKRSKPGKTSYRLFAVKEQGSAALIDTRMQMDVFEQVVSRGLAQWLHGCMILKRNPRLGSSVLDYILECEGQPVYVEVKSAVMRGDTVFSMYPDCPTIRGRRHFRELTAHALEGGRGMIVFISGLKGVRSFKPYRDGDPEIPLLLAEASLTGVTVKAISIHYDQNTGWIMLEDNDLPVVIEA
jgi:sugar fermentation stimulation protein A